jgi:predicted Na+-dependent transporter
VTSGPESADRLSRVVQRLERALLPLVVGLGLLGALQPAPARALTDAGAINLVLALLVASVGLSIDPADGLPSRAMLVRCVAVLAVSAAVLPLLAWLAGRLVADPDLRAGVLAAGVAPAEVASVAIVGLVGADAAAAVLLLVGSTALCVLLAGPVLGLLAGQDVAPPADILRTLLLVVALPLVAGLVAGRLLRRVTWLPPAGTLAGLLTVLALVWLVAAQIPLELQYLRVVLALVVFLAGSTALGALLAAGLPRRGRMAVLLPVAMRDFAIAAGIAAEAFGPASAAPLGAYGLLVLLLGAAATRLVPAEGGTDAGG